MLNLPFMTTHNYFRMYVKPALSKTTKRWCLKIREQEQPGGSAHITSCGIKLSSRFAS